MAIPIAASDIHLPALIVGEGQDEVMFFKAFLRHLRIDNVQPDQCGGKDKLVRQTIPNLRARSGFRQLQCLGITRDVDSQEEAAVFASIQNALVEARLPVPQSPGVLQPSLESGMPSVAVFLMPGNGRTGALEDLCLETIKDQPEHACVQAFFQCMEERGRTPPVSSAKAYLRAWLSAVDDDGRLGLAAQHNCFNWDHEAFTSFRSFLQLLAGGR